jgi:hypothetical protein
MKKREDKTNLFGVINWVLKNSKYKPSNFNVYHFIFNRWLSMVDSDTVNIINATTNRWMFKVSDFPFVDFYRIVLPKCTKKIDYIKKETSAIDDDIDNEIIQISENMELSSREILFLQKALEDLKTPTN